MVISHTDSDSFPKMLFGSYQMRDSDSFDDVISEAAKCGIIGFDTSPSYKTEEMLGLAVRRLLSRDRRLSRDNLFIQTKVDAWQMIEGKGDVSRYVRFALKKMDLQYFDAVLIHWPFPLYFLETWECLAGLKREGLIRMIGLCNVAVRHLERIEDSGIGEMPAIIQNEIHPLHSDEENTKAFQDKGIIVQSYSPLARMLPDLRDSVSIKCMAASHGRSVAQVVLRWHIQRGLVPIVKTERVERVSENSDIFSFSLSSEEMNAVSDLNKDLKIFLESRCCPGW